MVNTMLLTRHITPALPTLRFASVSYTHLVSGTVQNRDGAAYVLEFITAGGSHRLQYPKPAKGKPFEMCIRDRYSWAGVALGGIIMFLFWRRLIKRFFWKVASRSQMCIRDRVRPKTFFTSCMAVSKGVLLAM